MGRGWQWGGITKGHKEILGVMDMFIILNVAVIHGYTFWIHIQNFQIVHFKHMQFVVCQLCLNKAVF